MRAKKITKERNDDYNNMKKTNGSLSMSFASFKHNPRVRKMLLEKREKILAFDPELEVYYCLDRLKKKLRQ